MDLNGAMKKNGEGVVFDFADFEGRSGKKSVKDGQAVLLSVFGNQS